MTWFIPAYPTLYIPLAFIYWPPPNSLSCLQWRSPHLPHTHTTTTPLHLCTTPKWTWFLTPPHHTCLASRDSTRCAWFPTCTPTHLLVHLTCSSSLTFWPTLTSLYMPHSSTPSLGHIWLGLPPPPPHICLTIGTFSVVLPFPHLPQLAGGIQSSLYRTGGDNVNIAKQRGQAPGG